MKVIVPMAGVGSRLRPHTLTVPKPLTVIAGKTIVQRLVEDIAKLVTDPIEEIVFIIGPKEKGFSLSVKSDILNVAKKLVAKCSVFVQEEALGTAHAIHCAKSSLQGPCVIAFADTLFRADFTLDKNADGVIWVKQVTDPSDFGVVKLHSNRVTNFIEKPKEFISDLAIIGVYYFKNGKWLADEIQHLIDHKILGGGEYQLTDVLENMKQKNAIFTAAQVSEWMDCGKKDSTVDTNAKILQFAKEDNEQLISNSVVLDNSKIIEPCYIGKNVVLKNSKIGPYVSLGQGTRVENSNIKNSLIQNYTSISNVKLDRAMIGSYANFNGEFKSVSIGDYSELI